MPPKINEDKEYNSAKLKSEDLSKYTTSYPKAEKVVKPPRNPVTNKSLYRSGLANLVCKTVITKTIRKQPKQFTIKVPSGKRS